MVERSEKGSYARKDMEFFKVYLPEFSSRKLACSSLISVSYLRGYSFSVGLNIKINLQVIPPAFVNILEKLLPNQVGLLDEIGRLWKVETKTEEGVGDVVFKKGWEKFANDHSLEFGDFLVFSYDGVSRFSVKIFDKNGCKKYLVAVTTADRSRVAVEKEPVHVKPVHDISTKRCGKSRKRVSVKEEPSGNRVIHPCEMGCVPENKKHKGFEEPVYKPKNPHFVRNITNCFRQMEIPTTFLKSNGIEMEEDFELCDENGKKWPMKVVIHDRGQRFSPGLWLSFCRSHKLSTSNKCLFEFIVRSDGTCNQVLVRIFRGRMLNTVTINSYQVLAM
ncbi:unnamed protein product [Brassica oleracea var. botrytis]|uniref:(rape) hypothetical protein n=1 Tax=Brassica napus TaxID=3708 RepID=A0A816IQZ8_BRANA|nr:hypothetical protein HID58_084986 [Brassica napus]CAF1717061.1 unnamed protein product [Brassica napus]